MQQNFGNQSSDLGPSLQSTSSFQVEEEKTQLNPEAIASPAEQDL